MAISTESTIARFMRQALIIRMALDPSQVTISVAKYKMPAWKPPMVLQVVPGPAQLDGGGEGAQWGGALMRVQQFSVFYFGKLDTDPYGESEQILTNQSVGAFDVFEQLRQVFAMTQFGKKDLSDFLLDQPAHLVRESAAVWEEQSNGMFSREFVWQMNYGIRLPDAVTLYSDELLNALP